jgi:drug/metabolite transporter (DMT)-like permease
MTRRSISPAAAGLLAVVAATSLWATLGVVGKALYAGGAQALVVVAWRAILAGAALLAVLAVRAPALLRIPAGETPFFALYGFVAAANYACYFLALRHTTVAVAIVLLYTYPAFTSIAARVLYGEALDAAKVVALVLTFAGVVLVARGQDPRALQIDSAGIAFGLGAGITMAAYGLLGERATRIHSPWVTALYAFAFAAGWLTLAQGPRLASALAYTPVMWAGLLYMALGPTLLSYSLFLWAIQRIEVSRASLWTTLEPPVAALLAFAFLGETVDAAQGAGCALILTGIVILQGWRAGPRQAAPPPRPGSKHALI